MKEKNDGIPTNLPLAPFTSVLHICLLKGPIVPLCYRDFAHAVHSKMFSTYPPTTLYITTPTHTPNHEFRSHFIRKGFSNPTARPGFFLK